MFTGIIREIGTIQSIKPASPAKGRSGKGRGLLRLVLYAPKTASRAKPMESVSINGVCLTAVECGANDLVFEVIAQTQRSSALGFLRPGGRVNVEPSLGVSDRLGGHWVFGHIDGTGVIAKRKQIQGELILTIRLASKLRRLLVPKGPIAVNGVSLTVGPRLTQNSFTIHLIPETLRQTTLDDLKAGDRVNIELDYIAKLMWQFTKRK